MKSTAVANYHKFRRTSINPEITLEPNAEELAQKYVAQNYGTDSLWMIVSLNISSVARNQSITDYKKGLEEKIKKICLEKGKLPKFPKSSSELSNKSLPFFKGFSVLALPGNEPTLLLKYQLDLNKDKRNVSEPMLFMKFWIGKMLKGHTSFNKLVSGIDSKVFYHDDFAIFNLEFKLTSQGKEKPIEYYIELVQGVIEELKTKSDLFKMYEEARKELEQMYKTRETLETSALVNTLASKVPKFGSRDALISTELLKKFEEGDLKEMCNQLANLDNLLVIVSGDFPTDSASTPQRDSLLLEKPFCKRNSIPPFNIVTNGSIVLNSFSAEADVYYLFSHLDKSKVGKSKDAFPTFEKNPFAFDNVIESKKKPEKQVNQVGSNAFVKYSTKYGDRSYFKIEFQTQLDSSGSLLDLSKRSQVFGIVLNQRLMKARSYLQDYNGFINVGAHADSIFVEGLVGSPNLDSLVKTIEESLDVSNMLVTEEENCKSAMIHHIMSNHSIQIGGLLHDALGFFKTGYSRLSKQPSNHVHYCGQLRELSLKIRSFFIEGSTGNGNEVFEKFSSKFKE